MKHSIRLLTATLLLSGCIHASVRRVVPDAERVVQIAAASREFSARYERGDAAGQAEIYVEDGIIFPPGRPAIRGRAAIQAFWQLPAGERIERHRAMADSIVIVEATAYDWGTYTVEGVRGGQPYRGGGKYVIVWREVSPGTWRMHLDMWNAGPARAAAP